MEKPLFRLYHNSWTMFFIGTHPLVGNVLKNNDHIPLVLASDFPENVFAFSKHSNRDKKILFSNLSLVDGKSLISGEINVKG